MVDAVEGIWKKNVGWAGRDVKLSLEILPALSRRVFAVLRNH
jgi:hypothetical protein